MKKYWLLLAVLAILAIALISFLLIPKTSAPKGVSEKGDLIHVTSPTTGQVIKSPIIITGEARGNWYFEASFPVRILDANNKVLAAKPAQALSDWMTTDFVPFSVKLEFIAPTTDTGFLVLAKDNPSGLPEHDDEFRIPIRFR